MLRIGKFTTGDFCLDPRSKQIGRVSEKSSLEELCIDWLPSHQEQRVSTRPRTKQEAKMLQRANSWRKIDLNDFGLSISGCPTRVNKIVHSREQGFIRVDIVLTSLCFNKQQEIDREEVTARVLNAIDLVEPAECDIQYRHKGACIETLARLFFET